MLNAASSSSRQTDWLRSGARSAGSPSRCLATQAATIPRLPDGAAGVRRETVAPSRDERRSGSLRPGRSVKGAIADVAPPAVRLATDRRLGRRADRRGRRGALARNPGRADGRRGGDGRARRRTGTSSWPTSTRASGLVRRGPGVRRRPAAAGRVPPRDRAGTPRRHVRPRRGLGAQRAALAPAAGTLRSPSFTIDRRYLHLLAAGEASRVNVVVEHS